jgi:precorrin-6B C5,15-methyltransferase / cobalt-precorrin-6B C5,C15-methyltransferase
MIDVLGIGADGAAGLRLELRERVESADFLAGGERHLGYFPAARAECFVIRDNVSELVRELQTRGPEQRCVVLASGDPLFYGIGKLLIKRLSCVRIEPALSSMQLAFARACIAWQDAALASIHGRPPRAVLLPLLGAPLIGLFTQDGAGPAQVARFILAHGLGDYEAVVGENLGAPEERVSRWPDLQQLAQQHFAPLNYLILQRRSAVLAEVEVLRNRALAPGIPDDAFARPDEGPEVMTRQEVRSILLGKLSPGLAAAGDTVWDIGSGLGTVAVEVAVLRPHLEVVAVEQDADRAALLRRNRERFGAYNIRVVEGVAPEVLTRETERPQRVFIGGSGSHLPAIMDFSAERLSDSGRLLASFVTLEHLTMALERLQSWGWPRDVTEVQVARSDALAGLTGLKPQRGVFLVAADKLAR